MQDSSRQLEFIEVSARHANGMRSIGTSADAQRRVRSAAMKHHRSSARRGQGDGRQEPFEGAAESGRAAWRKHRADRKEARRTVRDGETTDAPEDGQSISVQGSTSTVQVMSPVRLLGPSSPLDLQQVTPRAVFRIALIDVFAHGFFPPSSGSRYSMFRVLNELTAIRSRAMELGNDALTLLHLGSINSDRRIVLAGHRKYIATIQYLQSELNSPRSDFDGMLAAAHHLLCMEIYRAVSSGDNAWAQHGSGLTALASECSKQPRPNNFRCFLFWQMRHFNLMSSLVARRPTSSSGTVWFSSAHKPSEGGVESLIQIAMQIPGLLVRIDALHHHERARQDDAAGLEAIADEIARALRSWFAAFSLINKLDCAPRESVSFAGDGYSLTVGNTTSLHFPSFLVATCAILCWCCMLLTEQSRFELALPLRLDSHHLHMAAADQYAEYIWQSLPYMEREGGGPVSKAASVNGALHFLFSWFDKSGNAQRSSQCRHLKDRLQDEMPFLHWNALLPYSFLGILWLS